MAKKRATSRDAGAAKPKQLRKRLRKAEDQLQDALTKRDRAQARVDALSIIADEIRSQLAEVEKAQAASQKEKRPKGAAPKSDTAKAKAATTSEPTPATKPTVTTRAAARKPAVAKSPATTTKPAAARKAATKPVARKPATARRTAAVASGPDTATTRKKPSTGKTTS